eukprot:2775465-Pleurochrysis_carterae.AAC.1
MGWSGHGHGLRSDGIAEPIPAGVPGGGKRGLGALDDEASRSAKVPKSTAQQGATQPPERSGPVARPVAAGAEDEAGASSDASATWHLVVQSSRPVDESQLRKMLVERTGLRVLQVAQRRSHLSEATPTIRTTCEVSVSQSFGKRKVGFHSPN